MGGRCEGEVGGESRQCDLAIFGGWVAFLRRLTFLLADSKRSVCENLFSQADNDLVPRLSFS